ncbi:Dickkopf_N domain-containing protein [Podarcis lilfordi]|uniref:Dickkopf_N domain-containing protein n=1 Tax=Podarcis lilfordi TaxID=74358 RepID=A0AA35L6G4_9SAUR|nr:Dickkopf_N domain-containing protein [Podarcis lilfordi]
MLLPLVWGFWCLTALMQGRTTASAAFLPPSVERLFKEFRNIFEQSREDVLGKDQLEPSVDISKLPSNYHNEEKHQRKVGNATVYSHREISKMTDNRTGEMVFSEKTVTSIEQADARPEEEEEDEEKKPVASQEENGAEADRESNGLRFLKLGPPQPRPRLTFLIFRLPQHLKSKPIPEANWEKEEPATDRRHRLLAIRNGLLTAPHPIKKKALPVTPNRKLLPRKHHFLFFWNKGICWKDRECCLGYLCVWGRCAKGVSRGESGTRCDPRRDKCAQGLCCTTSNSLSFPVCTPYPKEGEVCRIPTSSLFGLMGWGSLTAFPRPSQYCPCAQGLKCRAKRYTTVSTCENPENSVDISRPDQQLSFYQPILMRRDKEDAYYDDYVQDGQLALVNLPRSPYSMEDIGQPKGLSEDYYEKRQLPWEEDVADPKQADFQELKQLANEMGQYIGPGFY